MIRLLRLRIAFAKRNVTLAKFLLLTSSCNFGNDSFMKLLTFFCNIVFRKRVARNCVISPWIFEAFSRASISNAFFCSKLSKRSRSIFFNDCLTWSNSVWSASFFFFSASNSLRYIVFSSSAASNLRFTSSDTDVATEALCVFDGGNGKSPEKLPPYFWEVCKATSNFLDRALFSDFKDLHICFSLSTDLRTGNLTILTVSSSISLSDGIQLLRFFFFCLSLKFFCGALGGMNWGSELSST